MEPKAWAVKVQSPDHWTTREFPTLFILSTLKIIVSQTRKAFLKLTSLSSTLGVCCCCLDIQTSSSLSSSRVTWRQAESQARLPQLMLFSCSVVSNSLRPHGLQHGSAVSFTISQSLLKFMSIESVMPSSHFILCHPLLLPSIFPSIRVFSSESALHIRWPKYWSFSIGLSNEYSESISIRNRSVHLIGGRENTPADPGHKVCGILVPRPGIKPSPPAVEALKAQSLNHRTTSEVQSMLPSESGPRP